VSGTQTRSPRRCERRSLGARFSGVWRARASSFGSFELWEGRTQEDDLATSDLQVVVGEGTVEQPECVCLALRACSYFLIQLTAGGVRGTVAERRKKEPEGPPLTFVEGSIGCIIFFHGFKNSGSSHSRRPPAKRATPPCLRRGRRRSDLLGSQTVGAYAIGMFRRVNAKAHFPFQFAAEEAVYRVGLPTGRAMRHWGPQHAGACLSSFRARQFWP
jgi:hypothetical protein